MSHSPESSDASKPERAAQWAQQRRREIARTPFVVLTVKASGIHPATSRIVALHAVVLTKDGEVTEEFYSVINSGSDPGPQHLHGFTRAEVAEGKRFSQILKALGKLIDGRTLILNNLPMTWGFVVAEARRAMAQAARANRSRNRQRSRRQRVGHVPKPHKIVDTLASAYQQGLVLEDNRIRTIAQTLHLDVEPAHATIKRAQLSAREVIREETDIVTRIFFVLDAMGKMASISPNNLGSDRFGLQRSQVYNQAIATEPAFKNPGVYTPKTGLVQGMEVVIAPEVTVHPDALIRKIVAAQLVYAPKTTRRSSVVVCNQRDDLRGKAMHAVRKGIPLLSDKEFLRLVKNTAPGTPVEEA
ncbi:DNA polymerase III subunit epsilon [Corynebacterium kutscheri]|uniref:DNA polymerase III epsilon subunit-like 3'-5' exonuclease n=1 Tax=Corynebacterium kutscheri TaxID=35755 RepID=A0A0F6QYX8_9CORY|nr:DNA polymerase III subunit epsilon [Corynebacterium kutscheri]AKE40385.1 DNA polymerase III epsilon subunit-like 3'-5' exonuclease [Corynebacterium kutscheri]VEH05309.1 DNA polymerase III subunit epsilon [Corynebacterium kutscheri]VEH10780.1 DNA polymerase III subunit epsilon [Corynebacterium kutscheri]